jgi:hypothetical protein
MRPSRRHMLMGGGAGAGIKRKAERHRGLQAATQRKTEKFAALLDHIDIDLLLPPCGEWQHQATPCVGERHQPMKDLWCADAICSALGPKSHFNSPPRN